METEVVRAGEQSYPLTANAVVSRVRLIQEVMSKVMKKDTHYGVIPGTKKPTLYKPGAEQLLVTFRIAPEEPKVEDLSTPDSIRYRVTRTGVSNGCPVASGVGECSSDEEKYKWRKPVCPEEFDEAPDDRKREVWKYVKGNKTKVKQVRTNPADVANTILKMADKRAFVAMTLLATAASDIFTQDLEDLPPEVAESLEGAQEPKRDPIKPAEPNVNPPTDMDTFVFVPSDVKTVNGGGDGDKKNEGKNPGDKDYKRPWTKWGVKLPNGDMAGTFDENYGNILTDAEESGREVRAFVKQDGKFLTIVKVEYTK